MRAKLTLAAVGSFSNASLLTNFVKLGTVVVSANQSRSATVVIVVPITVCTHVGNELQELITALGGKLYKISFAQGDVYIRRERRVFARTGITQAAIVRATS